MYKDGNKGMFSSIISLNLQVRAIELHIVPFMISLILKTPSILHIYIFFNSLTNIQIAKLYESILIVHNHKDYHKLRY